MMKKYLFVFVLLLCVGSLFGQDLFSIAVKGAPEQVQAAINAGADVNAHNDKGRTALIQAAWLNPNPEVITTLLNDGAKVNARNTAGRTTLMYAAAQNSNPEVITTLIKAGADGKLKSSEGKTAFDYAKDNPKIKDTAAYWALNNARF
jgi:ankyrin repeat protein